MSDTTGTFVSDTPGTFMSDMTGTFGVILSQMLTRGRGLQTATSPAIGYIAC